MPTSDVIDKRNVLASLRAGAGVVLELGCGPRKQVDGAIGVDLLDTDAVDIVGDAVTVLRRMPAASVGRITSSHFFEHVPNFEELLVETARVLADGGTMDVTVPHFSNPYFYSDYTHRMPFGLYTFSYLADESLFTRKVPRYSKEFGFELRSVDLVFKSPWPVRNAWKRLVGLFANATSATKEFYEENLAFLFPCYEVKYVLVRKVRVSA